MSWAPWPSRPTGGRRRISSRPRPSREQVGQVGRAAGELPHLRHPVGHLASSACSRSQPTTASTSKASSSRTGRDSSGVLTGSVCRAASPRSAQRRRGSRLARPCGRRARGGDVRRHAAAGPVAHRRRGQRRLRAARRLDALRTRGRPRPSACRRRRAGRGPPTARLGVGQLPLGAVAAGVARRRRTPGRRRSSAPDHISTDARCPGSRRRPRASRARGRRDRPSGRSPRGSGSRWRRRRPARRCPGSAGAATTARAKTVTCWSPTARVSATMEPDVP